jgi:hypothetical protein
MDVSQKQGVPMKRLIIAVALFLMSCAGISERQRMESFIDMSEAYRRSLLSGDFAGAALFIAGSEKPPESEDRKHRLLKIADYNPTHVHVSQDHRRVDQEISIQYFYLNVNRLKNLKYRQVWLYDDATKLWMLQTDLPQFD